MTDEANRRTRDRYQKLMGLRARPHFVYRVFDEDDTLLYVGCTLDPDGRFKGHRYSHWFEYAARATWEQFDNFYEARAAESAAIKAEVPIFNTMSRPGPPQKYAYIQRRRVSA